MIRDCHASIHDTCTMCASPSSVVADSRGVDPTARREAEVESFVGSLGQLETYGRYPPFAQS